MTTALVQLAVSVGATLAAALFLAAVRSVLQMTRTVRTTAGAVKELVSSVDTLTGRVEDLEHGRRRPPTGPHRARQGFPL